MTAVAALLQATGLCNAQALQKVMTPAELVVELQKADTVDKALALFQPPVNKAQITKSDYLLLDIPPIALAGSISAHMMSELPGTDLLMLFNNKPKQKQLPLLAVRFLSASAPADVRMPIIVPNSTELLLVARAGGKFFSVTRDIRIAEKDRG